MDYLEEAKRIFKNDIFATETTGIEIEDAAKDYAKCSLKLGPKHMNALGTPMGGAIYTLADFTFAVAANTGNMPTVTVTSEITFLSRAKGSTITAEAMCTKDGERNCFFIIDIKDELDTEVATVTIHGYRKKTAAPGDTVRI